jgi:sugar transferase (PEP-CTERM system associated)
VIRLFKHYLPLPLLIFGLVECVLLTLCAELAWLVRTAQIGMDDVSVSERLPQFLIFAATIYLVLLGVGAYQAECFRSLRMAATRLTVGMLLGIAAISVVIFFFPDVDLWRSVTIYAIIISFVALLLFRAVVSRFVNWSALTPRILVIGAGQRGARLSRAGSENASHFTIAGHLRLEDAGSMTEGTQLIDEIGSLVDFCDKLRVDEIVLALDERRGAAPSEKLLEAKLAGIKVSEITSFLERQTGRVDLRSISPSWLIYSDGFLGSEPLAIIFKRWFDITASLLLLIVASPILLVTALLVRATSRGPIFYLQERVGQLGRVFKVIKFRSMVVDAERDGSPQWAQTNDPRVTSVGRFIRATRIDEIPQIFNVLRGDMSFVGPRPERPQFVEDLALQIPYYRERHIVKPGITGWAQLNYPYGASVIDARNKLEYDLYYIKNYSMFLDILILIQTARVVVWQDGVR